eukprot:jgi/Chrpa1/17676/Chrysochromulina_OHIO_Genome00025986-RA
MGRDIEQAWTKSFTIFLNSTVRLLASADQHSPINTGVMLLKPSLSIFEQAVRVLRRRRFDPLLGFDWVGRPRDALRHLRVMEEWDIINRTTMMRENDWNFVGGHACQGLFVYLFLVRSEVHSPVFAFPKNRTFRHEHNLGAMRARHFNAGHKPWKANVRCPTYFKFLEHADVDAGQEDHFCWQLFRRKNRCLQERLNRATCAECRFNFNLVSSCTGKPEKEFGRPVATGAVFEFGTITSDGLPYTLSNPPGEHEPRIFRVLRERHPLPPAVQSIDLTPMISVGLNGTGQIDLGRHYHGVTAMLLLQGRKIWALRPPADPACTHDVEGECSAILDVCAHYARPGAPVPACVQEAGETIVVPDGWYHGTCNNASWTVGWGGQNRRMALSPHGARCFHCRPASLPRFMTTAEPFVGAAHARAISAELGRSRQRKLPLVYAGGAGLAVSLASRALFMQFLELRMEQALAISDFLNPECLATYAFGGDVGGAHGDSSGGGVHGSAHGGAHGGASAAADEDDEATEERRWLFSSEHVYAYVHLSGPASATLRFREISTGESDVRRLALHAAAMWAGDALDE